MTGPRPAARSQPFLALIHLSPAERGALGARLEKRCQPLSAEQMSPALGPDQRRGAAGHTGQQKRAHSVPQMASGEQKHRVAASPVKRRRVWLPSSF